MAFKGIILFCFLLTLHKSYLELPRRGTEPVEQQPTEGLGLGSVIRSLRRSGFMGLNLITRPKRQPTKGNNALYLALLLLCAGDIETNPGPTNIITCLVMLFLLYITLDGCGWSLPFSLAAPVVIFSRQANTNGSSNNNNGGGGGGLENGDIISIVVPLVVCLLGLSVAIVTPILAVYKCHRDQSAEIRIRVNKQDESNEEEIEPRGEAVLKCRVESTIEDYKNPDGQGRSYKWYEEGNEETSLSDTDELRITNDFISDHEGVYRCIVTFNRSWKRWACLTKVSPRYTLKFKGSAIEACAKYLKEKYKDETKCAYDDDLQWPPTTKFIFVQLAMTVTGKGPNDAILTHNIDDKQIGAQKIRSEEDMLQQKVPIDKLEDILLKCKGEQKRVLIEGDRGSGKSTLSLHLYNQWAQGILYQDYKLVIFIRLREFQEATSLADILTELPEDVDKETVEREINGCSGNKVLFILDGWDELPVGRQKETLFWKILRQKSLEKCSFIVTSRPTSSADIRTFVSSRIDILGFTENNLRQFFIRQFQSEEYANTEAAEKEVDVLESHIKNNPIIKAFCYLPLNASILVYLHNEYKNDETRTFPNTQFDVFDQLVCHCIFRYQRRNVPSDRQQDTAPDSLDELPEDLREPFQILCEKAYEGTMTNQVDLDIRETVNTLGLLQEVRTSPGRKRFHFHHLSIQELLTAIHIAGLPNEEQQIEQLDKLLEEPARFAPVFQFFAAKTKLMNRGNLFGGIALKVMDQERLLLCLIHSLYEAQHSKSPRSSEPSEVTAPYKIVVDELESTLDLSNTTLNPTDCYSLGDFLTHCENFKVHLGGCSIGDEGCKALFGQGRRWNIKILYLNDNHITDEGAMALSKCLEKMANLEELSLNDNYIADKGAMALSKCLEKMANLHELYLNDNYIADEGAMALSKCLEKMANLEELYLQNNYIADEGAMALSKCLEKMANLRVLYLWKHSIGHVGRSALWEAAERKGISLLLDWL